MAESSSQSATIPGCTLRDVAATLGITERAAFGIVNDLVTAGYVLKDKDGRRNRYQVQAHLPLRVATGRKRSVGETLEILVDSVAPKQGRTARDNAPRGASGKRQRRAPRDPNGRSSSRFPVPRCGFRAIPYTRSDRIRTPIPTFSYTR